MLEFESYGIKTVAINEDQIVDIPGLVLGQVQAAELCMH